nr:integrase, catalytic region, zinc finger, CCHC-type, peptidase aspartic, catalytic [Tanacetum cinerariifolium]
GRQNRGQGTNPQGRGTTGFRGVQNKVGNANPGQARHVKCYNCNGGQDNTIDEDVDEQPVQDLALNMDNVFQADNWDAFNSDVDEALMAQTMFMANLSSADHVNDEAGPLYDLEILSEVHDHDHYQDTVCTHHEEHMMHNNVQLNHIVDSHSDYTIDSNMIPYDLYVKDNVVLVIHSNEETLKKKLHSVKLQLASTINHNKLMVEEFTSLKKDFKQKENKYLEDFLDVKSLKEMVEDRLFKQDRCLQTVHMLCRPKPYYDELNKVAIGYKNPLCLTRAKQIQPALSNGHEIIKDNHIPAIVRNTEDTLEIAKITRKKMNDKMKDPECVTHKKLRLPNVVLIENLMRLNEKILIANDNLVAEWLSKEVLSVTTNSELNVARFTKMHVAHTIVEIHCLELEAGLSNLCDMSHNDSHDELVKRFSNLEVHHLNMQLKYQNLKDSFGNNPPTPDKDTPDFDSFFVIGKMQASLQGKDNVIKKLQKQISHSAENDKIKQHYKELFDYIKITRTKYIEQVTALTTKKLNLNAQILNTANIGSKDPVKPKVLAPGKYDIDVEPIVARLRNNREAHLDYLRHLKESVETIRDIVEKAKVVRPLDSSIVSACRYTKHSKELLEYAIGTCPQDSHQQDKKRAPAPLIKKKQVTFADPCDKLNNNTHKHVMKLNTQKTNVPVPPSTGVNHCTDASRSHTRSNIKKNRISPAKGVNKLQVEEQPRTNKSPLRTSNRVDSSSRPKRTVVQIVLWYLDSGYSKQMTGDHSRLMNFMKKFIETFRFRNDHFGAIMGFGDYMIGDSVISRVYYVEGLGHNLFFVRQFCDADLEVTFRKHSCYVRDTDGVELIKGSCGSNFYTISVEDMMKSSPICLLSKASKNKSWLSHRRLNHLNFGIINDLTVPRTPQQNGVVEIRNRTLVEAAWTMQIFSKALIFLWAEAVATACYTQNQSLIHTRHNKTPYELCIIRSLILPSSECLVLFVILQMTAKILENFNQ